MTNRLSIGQKLPLLTGGLVLIVALLVFGAAYREVHRTALLTGVDRVRSAAIQFAQSIRSGRTTMISAIRPTARRPEIAAYLQAPDPARSEQVLDLLQYDGPQPSQVVAIELRDSTGRVLLATGTHAARLAASPISASFPRPLGPDSGLVGPFLLLDTTGRANPSSGARLGTPNGLVVYPTVVRPAGAATGYVVLWRQLAGNAAGVKLVNDLLGTEGKLVIGNADGSLWTDLAGVIWPAPLDVGTGREPVVRERAGPQGNYIAAAAPVEVVPWLVAAALPRKVLLAPLGGFVERAAALVAFCIGAGLIAAILLSRQFTQPLIDLSEAADALARGDYSRRVPVERADELGQLAGSFSAMAAEIEQSRNRLEASVAERTRDLAEALDRLRDTQAALVRREKLAVLGQLAGSVAHELRNPLGVMNNAVYYLEAVSGAGPESVKRYLEILRRQVALSSRIVDDLMDFTRVRPPQRETVALKSIVEAQLERLGTADGVQIEQEIPEGLPAIHVDPVQVGQVVFNLVTNAIQAMDGNGGTVTLRGRSPDAAHVSLEVSDTGPGVPAEHIESIFEPLFTTRVKGIGLGLAVSKSFAKANNGRLTVRSQAGLGATFELALPAAMGSAP